MGTWDGEDRFETVSGVRTRYRTGGEGDPVVVLHGFGGYIESWSTVSPTLAEHREVYAIDLPGHGETDTAIDDYSLPSLADFLAEFMTAVDIDRADVVGLSFGTCVATALAQSHPQRVNRLALVAPAFLDGTVPLQFRLPVLPVIGRRLMEATFPADQADVERLAEQVIHKPENRTDAWIERTLDMATRPGRTTALHRIASANLSVLGPRSAILQPLEEFLHTTEMPILVVHGREDALIGVSAARSLAATIPNSELIVVDDCGHEVPHERPEDLSEWLLDFLEVT